jgi:hypothetical protein
MNVGAVDKHPLTQPSPPRGRGLIGSSPLPVGEGWVRAFFKSLNQPHRHLHRELQQLLGLALGQRVEPKGRQLSAAEGVLA